MLIRTLVGIIILGATATYGSQFDPNECVIRIVSKGDTHEWRYFLDPDRVREFISSKLRVESGSWEAWPILVKRLTARELQVVILRYHLSGDGPRSLDAIAKGISLSDQRVREILAAAEVKIARVAQLLEAPVTITTSDLGRPFTDLDLPKKVLNALAGNGITTFEDLTKITQRRLARLKGMGKVAAQLIATLLAERGVSMLTPAAGDEGGDAILDSSIEVLDLPEHLEASLWAEGYRTVRSVLPLGYREISEIVRMNKFKMTQILRDALRERGLIAK